MRSSPAAVSSLASPHAAPPQVLTVAAPLESSAEVLAVPVPARELTGTVVPLVSSALPGNPDVDQALASVGASGAPGEVTRLPVVGRTILGVGVGDWSADALRRAGAALARAVRGRAEVATVVADNGDAAGLTAFVEGIVLGSFRYSLADRPEQQPVGKILLGSRHDGPVLDRAVEIARAAWRSRWLATVPSNIKDPAWLAGQAEELAAASGLGCRVWDEHELTEGGFGGILAVGRGSVSPPRLVQLEHRPARGGRKAPHVVLVGKGITFDSGGLSIKPGEAMVNMKRDMTGAAVVAGVLSALPALGCRLRVTGLLPCAENSIGGDAMRPGDVLRHYGGTTVEVTNTDAEGRLVLADAMQYAVEELQPDLLVDVATLTGAMKIALGLHTGGFFATSDAIADQLDRASRSSGERVWRMPLVEEYAGMLHSRVADLNNSPDPAKAITAALFLRHFTGGLPWAHLDVASVGDVLTDKDEWTVGPSGFGTRLLLHWLTSDRPLEGIA